MFRCSECGNKFSDKPDYCECGNNTFEKISEPVKKLKLPIGDILSLVFFVFCLILSAAIWFIDIDENKNGSGHQNKPEQVEAPIEKKSDIPDIETLWKNSKPVTSVQTEVKPSVNIKLPIPEETPKINQSKQVKKPVSSSPVNISKQAVKKNLQKPVQKAMTKKSAVSENSVKNDEKLRANQELTDYKTGLRKALFRYIDFTQIQGAGECIVEFNIDNSGKLTNRKFVLQSPNESVNSSVYKMMMSMPKYYPPPASYRGENIKMSFYFKNGYYEINYL